MIIVNFFAICNFIRLFINFKEIEIFINCRFCYNGTSTNNASPFVVAVSGQAFQEATTQQSAS